MSAKLPKYDRRWRFERRASVDAILERLRVVVGAENDGELALMTGLARSTVSTWRRRRRVPFRFLFRMEELHGVSWRFLFCDGGASMNLPAFISRIVPQDRTDTFDWRSVHFPPGYRFERLFERCDSKTFYNFKGDSVRIECGSFEDVVSSGRSDD